MDAENTPDDTFEQYISWIKSLRCSLSTTLEAHKLVNCRSFAEILHRIDEKFFPENWVEKIIDYDEESNWRPKANNLNKLVRRISEYIEEHATRTIKGNAAWHIEDQIFVEEHEAKDLNKILCLIVGCAFMGRNKEEFVGLITQQSAGLQVLVMNSVQYIMKNSEQSAPLSPQTYKINEQPPTISNGAPGEQKQVKLKKEIEELKVDKERLESELETAKQKIFEYSSNRTTENLEAENQELRKRKEELEDRLVDMEAKLETVKGNFDASEEELETLREKMNQIHTFEEDYRRMKDEVDELRNKELELSRVSRELEGMKQRNKDALIDKTELNVLREKSSKYVQDMIVLEDEKNRSKTLRQQLASLKAQKEEMEMEANKHIIRLNKLEAELAETKGKLALAEKKSDDLVSEKLELQGRIRELELHTTHEPLTSMNSLGSELETTRPLEDRGERMKILDLENEASRLREHIKELEGLQLEQREWQTTKNKNVELESKLQIAQEKISDLKKQLTSLETQLENPQANVDVNQLRIQLEQKSIEINTLKERMDHFEKKTTYAEDGRKRAEESAAELKKLVEQRNDQLRKAKQLLTDQEHKLATSEDGGPTIHQMDVVRKDLETKEMLVKNLQAQIEKLNISHEEEMRLVASSYHEMAKDSKSVHRLAGNQPRSFLKKQLNASAISS